MCFEIRSVRIRINGVRFTFCHLKFYLWSRRKVSMRKKDRDFQEAMRPIPIYSCETWPGRAADEGMLVVFDNDSIYPIQVRSRQHRRDSTPTEHNRVRYGCVRKEPSTGHRGGSHRRTTKAAPPPGCPSTKSVPTDAPEISNPTASTTTEHNRVHETSLPSKPQDSGYCQKCGKITRHCGHINQGRPLDVLACVLPHVN